MHPFDGLAPLGLRVLLLFGLLLLAAELVGAWRRRRARQRLAASALLWELADQQRRQRPDTPHQ